MVAEAEMKYKNIVFNNRLTIMYTIFEVFLCVHLCIIYIQQYILFMKMCPFKIIFMVLTYVFVCDNSKCAHIVFATIRVIYKDKLFLLNKKKSKETFF